MKTISKKIELSIIITSYKKAELLELCINSIRNSLDNSVNYEIIVVDSATEESTYDLMREKFSEIKFLNNKNNCGFGYLVNQGLKIAQGSYFLIINHDILIKENAIQKLLQYIKQDEKIGLVGPKLINFDGSTQISAFRFYSWRTILYRRTFLGKFSFAKKQLDKFLMKDILNRNKIIDVDWVMGSAMMVSAKAVKKVGLFDKRFFLYFEDVDWCWRFWQNGYKVVYNSIVMVAHYHGKASSNRSVIKAIFLNKYTRVHIISAFKFFIKHFGENNPHKLYYKKYEK